MKVYFYLLLTFLHHVKLSMKIIPSYKLYSLEVRDQDIIWSTYLSKLIIAQFIYNIMYLKIYLQKLIISFKKKKKCKNEFPQIYYLINV